MMPPPPDRPEPREREHLYHDLRTTLTHLRLRTQLLRRLAHQQDGSAWQRMAEGLAEIETVLSRLARQIDEAERR